MNTNTHLHHPLRTQEVSLLSRRLQGNRLFRCSWDSGNSTPQEYCQMKDPFPNRLRHRSLSVLFCWLVYFSFCSNMWGKDSKNRKLKRHFNYLQAIKWMYSCLKQVARKGGRCLIPGNIQGQAEWVSEQPVLVVDVPACCRGVRLDDVERSLLTQTILWLYGIWKQI